MNESLLRSIEKGTFMIKESKKKSQEIYVRIRLESGQIVKVNKSKDGSKRNVKADEIVILEIAHIIDIRNSDEESLFHKKQEMNGNILKLGINRFEKNLEFRFTIHHGLQFNLKTVSFRALNTAHYFDWITGLKYLVEQTSEMTYDTLVESWLWKHYYEIGESVTEHKAKGPVEIDDEFIIPLSLNKASSSSLVSLSERNELNKSHRVKNWSDDTLSLNKDIKGKSSHFKIMKNKNEKAKKLQHFRRYSWCSNVSLTSNSFQKRFASPDNQNGGNMLVKSFNVKISPKQLAVWLVQQNGTKIAIDNIKEYNSNYPPKPNYIDFSGLVRIYKELFYQPETFMKFIESRIEKLRNGIIKTLNGCYEVKDNQHLNSLDLEWIQSIKNYTIPDDLHENDLDSWFSFSNSIWDPQRAETVYQDMDQPLSAYYLSTSHNSYLTGDQITSKSSCEAYTRCIQMGCRSVELDCWNGDREPIIYHGNTLTSKIKLADVLQTIRKCAWLKSNYPLILSLEDHCDIQQQIIIAQMMQETFQEQLLKAPIKLLDLSSNQLPSPNQLKNKIILKHKKLPIDSVKLTGSLNGLNESGDECNDTILSNYLYSGRMYMKDLFLETWTPYYFLMGQNRILVYTEDTSVTDNDQHVNQICLQKPNMQLENCNFDLDNFDNSARFITIDHSEKLAINCNNCTPSELTNKKKLPNWFYGSLSRQESNHWLLRYWFLGDGSFLIRTSESFPGNYSLSFYRKDKVHHVRICRFFDNTNNKTSLGFEHCDIQFLTMEDLVSHYQENDMVALDFKIRLKNPPPERFQDKSWFYENPPFDIKAIEDIFQKIPLVGSFLVSRTHYDQFSVLSDLKMSNDDYRDDMEEHFILSYKSRGNLIVHITITYDEFQYTISGHSSNSLVELIDYFHKNRLSDGVRLKYPADSNLVGKCNLLSKISPNYPFNHDGDLTLNCQMQNLKIRNDSSLCSSVTANDLLSLHQDQEEDLSSINGHIEYDKSTIVTITESVKKIQFKDKENGDSLNLGPLGNMEMGNFQLDSDCYVKLPASDINNASLFMFPFDLFIVDFKIQLACETELQRSGWINAITQCLDINLDNELHLLHREKEIQHKIAKPLSDLIVYCSSVPFSWPDNPEDYARLLNSPCREMSSISEKGFVKLFSMVTNKPSFNNNNHNNNNNNNNNDNSIVSINTSFSEFSFSKLNDLIEYHKLHLTRVYPKGTRLDSSNLSPIIPWLSGVQMAAINFQTPDRSMQLNQALFRDNGGCGYVLKDSTVFSPSQHLDIRLTFLGARHLPRISKGLLEIEILSIYDELSDKRSFPLKSEFRVTDVDIPDICFQVINPNFAFIRFSFGSEEKLGLKKKMNSCQATFLVRGIRPGIRSVNFRNGFDYQDTLATLLFHVNLSITEGIKEH